MSEPHVAGIGGGQNGQNAERGQNEPDRLDRIREQLAGERPYFAYDAENVRWLVAEVERLRAELEQVRRGAEASVMYGAADRGVLDAENARLRHRLERIEAALRNRTATCVELAGQLERR